MGEVIAFKPVKDGVHLRPSVEGSAKIVTFTGGWHVPKNDRQGNSAPDLEKAAWYQRCCSKFLRALGPAWPWVLASLHGTRNHPDEAMQATGSALCKIPEETKRRGMSS